MTRLSNKGLTCSLDRCEEPAHCKRMCRSHYEKDLKVRNPAYAERQRENVRDWVARNPERKRRSDAASARRASPEANRRRQLKYKYGLSLEDFEHLLAEQEGACAVCRRTNQKWHVDHDHMTGMVRGILCNRCNNGLGLLGDTYDSIRKALNYLAPAVHH